MAWIRALLPVAVPEAWDRLMSPEGLLHQGSLEGLAEGDRYALTTADGFPFEGEILILDPPWNFTATAENLNHSLLRVYLGPGAVPGQPEIWLWLATYGLPQDQVARYQRGWEEIMRRLFPGAG